MEARSNFQSFFDDGDEHVGRDRGPDLRLQGILGRTVELLDPKMLLDPLEEEPNLTSTAVQFGERQRGQYEVVRQEYTPLAGIRVVDPDATQRRLEILAGVETGQEHCPVADEAGTATHGTRIATPRLQIRFAAGDEEAAGRMKPKEPLEFQVSPIHNVEGSAFRNQLVEDIDVVPLDVSDVDICRDIAAKIDQRMQLHGHLHRAKRRSGEDREPKIDCRGVQRAGRLVQIHAKRFVDVQLSSHRNQALRERRIDTPVAHLVRICECAARDLTADSNLIELVALRPQACLDVPKALAAGE